jgi:predicted MFS family arabinose efflux permease
LADLVPTGGNATPGADGGVQSRPSAASVRGLEGLNFLMADVAGGLGPYLSVYLAGSQHWGPGDIGVAMAASGIAAAIFQIPAGFLVDASRLKRALVTASGLVIALGCLLTAAFPGFYTVILAQILIGLASAIIPPAIAALTLGLVGRRRFDGQTSRNQTFNHGGNFVSAILAGSLGQYLGYAWIFYLVCAFAVASTIAIAFIKPSEIDHDLARGGEAERDASGRARPMAMRDVLKRKSLVVFLVSVMLFHFGNAAMLPMAGQVLALKHPGQDTIALSACIIAAQFVMMGIAWGVGRAMTKGYGRKTIFLVAFAVLPIRGLLFTVVSDPIAVVAVQLLDGVAAGIFGVIATIIAADIMKGTGRFNVAQGLVALSVGIGASLSNIVAGYVVQLSGYPIGFLFLAVVAGLAFLFFAVFMPETRVDDDLPSAGHASAAPTAA